MIAQTILQQLGGKRFAVMTGAHTFTDDGDALTFRLPGKSGYVKDGINVVRVRLTAADDYEVEFFRHRGMTWEIVYKTDGIYCDQLREVFENHTGLRTSL